MPRAVLALVAAGALVAACGGAPAPTCAQLAHRQQWAAAVPVCQAAFAARHDPDDGVRLLTALERSQRIAEAAPVAAELRRGPRAADGAYYLGLVAMHAERYAEAEPLLREAQAGYAARGDDHRTAEAAHQLAGTHRERAQYLAAAEALRQGLDAARRSGDRALLGYYELARADLLQRVGADVDAEHALERAGAALDGDPLGRAWTQFKLGTLHVEHRRYAVARLALEGVLAHAGDRAELFEAAHFQLAWIDMKTGHLDDAEAHLAQLAARLDTNAGKTSYQFATAELRARRGAPAAGRALLEAIPDAALDDEWAWVKPLYMGRMAIRSGDLAVAERDLRRAIAEIERQLRSGVFDKPVYFDSHRAPYYDLFALHARAGRWDAALGNLVALDAQDLLDATSDGLLRWGWAGGPMRRAPAAPPPTADEEAALVAALRASSRRAPLVIAIVAGDQLWRIELRGGEVTGAALADADTARALVDAIAADPDDAASARRLGELMLPAGLTDDPAPLYVAPLGELGQVPLAALRVGDARVIDRRPLVRLVTLRVPGVGAAPAGDPLVLGNPTDDLPRAADEAAAAGAALQVTPRLGAAATAAQLLGSQAPVIHVASHAALDDRGPLLRLGDRAVYADELEAVRWPARLVVLASCGSAAARDQQGRGSLAGAFVRGGASMVLGTQWSVGDAATAQLMRAFYAAGGAERPAAALAAAQRALIGAVPTRQWAAFTLVSAPPPPP